MKSWVKVFVVGVFIFLWCYLTFSSLVTLPKLNILKDMSSGSKSSDNKIDWKTVGVDDKSVPPNLNKKDVHHYAGTVRIEGVNVFYHKTSLPDSVTSSGQTILLLHGKSFTSQVWQDCGTMVTMAALGHLVVAVDLPGYGNTKELYHGDRSKFLLAMMQSELLNGSRPVLISPSMSGEYSVKFVAEHADMLSGYIPIAPVATSSVPRSVLQSVKVPTLIMYGENDSTPMAKEALDNFRIMPNSREVVLKNAGHAAYLNVPDVFHKLLYNFMELLHQ